MRVVLTVAVAAVMTVWPPAAVGAAPPLRVVEASPIATGVDLADLVPAAGRLDHVWYVARGQGAARVVVAWHFQARRASPAWPDPRRYVLTVWTAKSVTQGSARWIPQTLVGASPFPLSSRSVRLADVTGDGADDYLVTIVCSGCNHATALASIYAAVDGRIRKIYGFGGVVDVAKGLRPNLAVHGRLISETAWGARGGLVWFDEPRGGTSVCCPAFRLQTFLRWTGRGWRVVSRHKVSPAKDPLLARGFPAP